MRAMMLEKPGAPLRMIEMPVPQPAPEQLLIQVRACGVCRTDLHICAGELAHPTLPLIMGHEIVGTVVGGGSRVSGFTMGTRVGVPWLAFTCGQCRYCRKGHENLCARARFTGYTVNGGYAEYAVADQNYCYPLPESFEDAAAAPLLCAGLIGYRAYRMAGTAAERLGIYGFGAAAHIVAQIAVHQGKRVYAFTRPGDRGTQTFARELGAHWAGDAGTLPPEKLDAAIIFAPAGELVIAALRASDKGGVIVCGGIHMSAIPSFPYHLLWEERVLRSVANLTRQDGEELLRLASAVPVKTQVQTYKLEEANMALQDLQEGKFRGAVVLVM